MSSLEGDTWIQLLVYVSSNFAGVSRGSQQDDPAHFIPANWVGIHSILCPRRKLRSAVTSSFFSVRLPGAEAGLSRHDGKALESKKTVSALDDLIDIPLPLLILSGVCLELQACNTCLSLGSSSLKHLLSTPRSAMATTCSVGCDMLIAETKVRLVLPAARITIEK
eukprot:TRINITY_DN31937_c0_g1_i1.p2 TRINITY_DN31937_c0_g1~~TRINITY_DN31937_c0_g1_i1.p2  ORF type:complete len:166 (+),score=8.77 TRINITY_DN31937_c0_g1_i1:2273-2770(+)